MALPGPRAVTADSDCEEWACADDAGAELLSGQAPSRRAARCGAARAAGGLVLAVLALSAAASLGGGRWRRPLPADPQNAIKRYQEPQWAPPPSDDREKCGEMEDDMDFKGIGVAIIYNVASEHMCCSACAAYDNCTTWVWGKKRGTEFFTDVCWLSKPEDGAKPEKVYKEGTVAGFKSPGVQKHGVKAPPASTAAKLDDVVVLGDAAGVSSASTQSSDKCVGTVEIVGRLPVSLVSAGANVPGEPAAETEVLADGKLVVPHMGARVYFADGADGCTEGEYDPSVYSAINFLDKTISWTTDVSGTNCGCNAAFYLVSMRQNTEEIGTCNDYYCDAQSVCGVPCGEIDLMEANMFSWLSTLHTHNPRDGPDGVGVGPGYGGSMGVPSRRDWAADKYGPGSECIDTLKPFQVAVSFPTDAEGTLAYMEVELSQGGCSVKAGSPPYMLQGRQPLQELTTLLKEGMTPVISYWNSEDMLWMDGLALDGLGPCVRDDPSVCPDWVRFWDFKIENIS